MAVKIESKITGYSVVKEQEEVEQEIVEEVAEPVKKEKVKVLKRPEVLPGNTYKIKNVAEHYNVYVTVNYLDNKPFEVFFTSSHTNHEQWVKALSRLISAMLRTSDFNLEFVARELLMIHSSQGYMAGAEFKYVSGIIQHIGKLLLKVSKEEFCGTCTDTKESAPTKPSSTTVDEAQTSGSLKPEINYLPDNCPECGEQTMVLRDGCPTCECGYSKCG